MSDENPLDIDGTTGFGALVAEFMHLVAEAMLEAEQYVPEARLKPSRLFAELIQGHAQRFVERHPEAPEHALNTVVQMKDLLIQELDNPDLRKRWS